MTQTTTWEADYATTYQTMRDAAQTIGGRELSQLARTCQTNPWLEIGGVDFEDGLLSESDYPYTLWRFDDLGMLALYFEHGNWAIRNAVQYGNLIFVQQVNGGDEWWTLSVDDGKLTPFESISFRHILKDGRFPAFIAQLLAAPLATRVSLDY